MNKTIAVVVAVLTVMTGGFYYLHSQKPATALATKADYKNIAYTIEGQQVQLVDGASRPDEGYILSL